MGHTRVIMIGTPAGQHAPGYADRADLVGGGGDVVVHPAQRERDDDQVDDHHDGGDDQQGDPHPQPELQVAVPGLDGLDVGCAGHRRLTS